jgi:hypothetical protein
MRFFCFQRFLFGVPVSLHWTLAVLGLCVMQGVAATPSFASSTPRYVVIDLGTSLLCPEKVTNSGMVLGSDGRSSRYAWSNGNLSSLPAKPAKNGTPNGKPRWSRKALPQVRGAWVEPCGANNAVKLLRALAGPSAMPAQWVEATQVVGNGPGGGYLWEMQASRSMEKVFNRPIAINDLLPKDSGRSSWKVISVSSINDGGAIAGTAIYSPRGSLDPIVAGRHGVLLLPLAIVRETTPGSGDFEPIRHNGLDDEAVLPIYGTESGKGKGEKRFGFLRWPCDEPVSTPATDGQGIFYVQLSGMAAASVTLANGDRQVTVQAVPVEGKPDLLRTGKLVLIEPGDPFRSSGITCMEVGPALTLELQMYGQTVVR